MIDIGAKIAQAQRLVAEGKAAQALLDLRRAIQQAPGDPSLNSAMGMVLMTLGQPEQAIFYARRAVEARPDDPAHLSNMGMWLGAMNRQDEAYGYFVRAAERGPGMPQVRLGLANVLRARGEYTGAAEQLEIGLRLAPGDAAIATVYAAVLTNLARVSDSVTFARGRLAQRADPQLAGMYANAMNYCAEASPEEVFRAQVSHGRMVEALAPRRLAGHPNGRDAERPLRVGVLSAELRRHPVATFLEPWLEHRDRTGSQLTCFVTSAVRDAVTARMRGYSDAWVDGVAMSDSALADRVRAERIDILIETTGVTQGHRLGVMAMKPAPVQVTYCGYPSTTGLAATDYRIVDGRTDPPGSEGLCVERLVRLEPVFLCYRAPADAPAPGSGSADGGGVVFGSFNSAPKINDPLIALWSRVLGAVAGSRLILKALDFKDAALRLDVARRFERAGVEAGRVEVLAPVGLELDHLGAYGRIDIGLDPTPYNGTTTTCEAMWMGVPVVTLAGSMHAGRVGLSLLETVGLADMVAADEDQYVGIAARLAGDVGRRAELRGSLRGMVAASALCDAAGFAARMDAAVRGMWREWCGAQGAGPGR